MKSFHLGSHLIETTVTYSTIKRVLGLTGVNLIAAVDEPEILKELSANTIQLVDVLYAAVKPQLDALNLTDEQFGEMLDGGTIEAATEAFLAGLVDFFPGARGDMLKRVLARAKQQLSKIEADLRAAIDSGKIDTAVDKALAPQTEPAS